MKQEIRQHFHRSFFCREVFVGDNGDIVILNHIDEFMSFLIHDFYRYIYVLV